MKSISIEHSEEILRKMHTLVGLLYQDTATTDSNWFHQTTWTHKSKTEFLDWLTDFLIKNRYCSKNRARHEAEKIDTVYGWRESVDKST